MPLDLAFIGTYTAPGRQIGHDLQPGERVMGMVDPTGSRGLYVCRRDRATGALTPIQVLGGVNPSYVALDGDERFLFAANEVRVHDGAETGTVTSYAIDDETGTLRPISRIATGGGNPCHIEVTEDGRFLLVANHEGGSAAVMAIGPDGALRGVTDLQPDEPVDARQSHVHFATQDPSGRFVLTTNTGTDRVRVRRFDAEKGRLTADAAAFGATHRGGSPRHLAFSAGGRHVFTNGEADLTLSLFRFDPETGVLAYLGHVPTAPPGTGGTGHSTAHMLAHPDGRFVYVANRGSDTIAIFAFDEARETLTPVGYEPTRGLTPRYFQLAPGGGELYVANQNSATIERFLVDRTSGLLHHAGRAGTIPAPTCIQFTTR